MRNPLLQFRDSGAIIPVVPDTTLIRQASLKASGADIHDVRSLICAYEETCRLLDNAQLRRELGEAGSAWSEPAILAWASAWQRKYEECLYAYIAGTPVKKLISGPNQQNFTFALAALLRSAGSRVRRLGNRHGWGRLAV